MKRSISLPPTHTTTSSCASSNQPSQQRKKIKMSNRRLENENEWTENSDRTLLNHFIQLSSLHEQRDFKSLDFWNMARDKLNNILNPRGLPNIHPKSLKDLALRLQHLKQFKAAPGYQLKDLVRTLFFELELKIPSLITKSFSRDRSRSPTQTTTAPSNAEGPSNLPVSDSITSAVPPPSDIPKFDTKLYHKFWSVLRRDLNIDPATIYNLAEKTTEFQKNFLISIDDIDGQAEFVEHLKGIFNL